MYSNRIYFLLLPILCGLLLLGCSRKSQALNEDTQDDLFVEYHEYYFPKKIETLALGEIYGYNGRDSYYKKYRKGLRRGRGGNSEGYSFARAESNLPKSRRQLLRYAESAIGTPYVLGGTSPGGFDCSGLVCWAYGNVGVKLPRTAREQSVVGTRITRIEDMEEGDIVAFRHPRRGYHTGIYVGGGKFIHSPRRKSHVKINSLSDPYFSETFLSARRVKIGSRENLLAQAEDRLRSEYSFKKNRLRVNHEDSRVSRNAGKGERWHKDHASRHHSKKEKFERRGKKKHEEVLVAENKRSKKVSHESRKERRRELVRERNHEQSKVRSEKKKRTQTAEKHGKADKKKNSSRKS